MLNRELCEEVLDQAQASIESCRSALLGESYVYGLETVRSLWEAAGALRAAADAVNQYGSVGALSDNALIDAIQATRREPSLIGRVGGASLSLVLAERWLMEIVGNALAAQHGPSWTDIGAEMWRLGPDGNPIHAPVSRQGARQRFANFPVVKRQRLAGVERRLLVDLNSVQDRINALKWQQETGDRKTGMNDAELAKAIRELSDSKDLIQAQVEKTRAEVAELVPSR